MKIGRAEIFLDYGEIVTMMTPDNGERSLYLKKAKKLKP
jgi:hypothetical protein